MKIILKLKKSCNNSATLKVRIKINMNLVKIISINFIKDVVPPHGFEPRTY